MSVRRMPEIVPERDSLGQVLVESQAPRNSTGDLTDFERVREPSAVMIALGR